jgi:hypothetical protein
VFWCFDSFTYGGGVLFVQDGDHSWPPCSQPQPCSQIRFVVVGTGGGTTTSTMDSTQSLSLILNAEWLRDEEAPDSCHHKGKVDKHKCHVFRHGDDPRDVQLDIERAVPRCHTPDGFLRTKVTRLDHLPGHQRRQYLLSLEVDQSDYPLFMAEKDTSFRVSLSAMGFSSRFTIRGFHKHGSVVLGTLMKQRDSTTTHDSTIIYTLSAHKSSQTDVAYIRYEVPSVLQVLMDRPPRRALVELPGRGYAETIEPASIDGKKTLNFHGRGREASCKNMQLKGRDGKVVLQFVKWNNETFHLDFR